MAKIALPIKSRNDISMETALPVFSGGVNANYPVLPVSIDNLIDAERESLSDAELAFQKKNGTNAIPSSFDAAERFCNTLKNPPGAGQVKPEYNVAINEYIGLLAIFACRNLLGLNVTSRTIDLSENSGSALLKGLGNQLSQHGNNRMLTYFCIDNKPFAYIYNNCIVPIKDKENYKKALISVPFFNGADKNFDDILAATTNEDDVSSGKLLFKQLLYAFLYNIGGMFNANGSFLQALGAPYLDVTQRIANSFNGVQPLSFVQVGNVGNTLYDVLMNAPFCPILPDNLFSENALLLLQNNHYKPPCFGQVVYEDELYNVVNPMSSDLCDAVSQPNGSILLDDPDGAPDCSGSNPDEDGCITCRIRLIVNGVKLTVQRKYAINENCVKSDRNNISLESINMGIDCNINPCETIPSIFRRYIVWNCPECVTVSFPQPLGTFPVKHLSDKAFVAIVEPNMPIPKFAYLNYYGKYCGCIKFPAPIEPINTMGNTPTSIYLDFGTTNTICLVEYGGNPDYVDIKEYVTMVTGDQGNADFRIYHLLSDPTTNRDTAQSNEMVRSMAICSLEGNRYNSPLYRAHALNAGKDALDMSINEILRQRSAGRTTGAREEALDLASVNVYDNLKWTDNNLANEGYRAVVGSIFSSAFAKLLKGGYNPNFANIYISVPSSMNNRELMLTSNRVQQALSGIRANLKINGTHYESTAAAYFIINDPNGGINIGNDFNVGVDIGGGSIDLFSFRSKIGIGNRPIPSCIDSVKNAAGRKILSETFVQAVRHYYHNRANYSTDRNPFFSCFLQGFAPSSSLNSASDNAAICITETFIPDSKFQEDAIGNDRIILNTFRRNVLFKTIAVLNYAAEFVKVSWQKDENGNDMDFSNANVNIILCGNGSSIWDEKWSGADDMIQGNIIDFLKSRIGCNSLNIQASPQPKKETVMGMTYIQNNQGGDGAMNFDLLNVPATLGGGDTVTVQNYVDGLVDQIIGRELLSVSNDVDNLNAFHSLLRKEVNSSRVKTALNTVLNKDSVHNKGNALFLADVFLRLALDLPFIDPYN